MVNTLWTIDKSVDNLSIKERQRRFSDNSLDAMVSHSDGHLVKPQSWPEDKKSQIVAELTNDTWLSIDSLLPTNSDLPVADKKNHIITDPLNVHSWNLSLSDLWLGDDMNLDYTIDESKLSKISLWTAEQIDLTLCDFGETYISDKRPINIEGTIEEYDAYVRNLEKINLQGDIMIQFYELVLVPLLENTEHEWLQEILSSSKPVHIKLNYLLSNFGFERSYLKLWNWIDKDTNISKEIKDINKRFVYRKIANYVDVDLKTIY